MADLYSITKPAWHGEALDALRRGERPRPIHVQLILSDLCNQDCGFCAYRMSAGLSHELFVGGSPLAATGTNNPKRMIPTPKALEIIDDCAALGVKALQFTGGGEPTVHPDHLMFFARAQAHSIETALVTNGIRLSPNEPAVRAMAWVRISVDAGDAETYCRVRRAPEAHWRRVWSNIGQLAADYCGVLGVGFVVTPENYHTIAAAARLAREHGAHNIRIGAVFSKEGLGYYPEELLPRIREQINGAAEEARPAFEVVDLFGRRIGDLEAGRPDDPECYYQYLTVYIGGDLNVYRCCNTAYTAAGKVGSLAQQRFLDAVLAYEPFDARGCQHCQFLGQNKTIAALVQGPPQHVNFV